jgi:ferrous iron transport protein B
MLEAGWAFILRAGTIIFAAMVIVWALLYFPHTDGSTPYYQRIEEAEKVAGDGEERLKELKEKEAPTEAEKAELEKLEREAAEPDRLKGRWMRESYLGRTGRFLEPVVRPLGWDWKIGTAALASFPAREVVVGTMGLLYDVGDVDPGAVGNDEAEDEDKAKAAGLAAAVQADWASDPVRGKYGVAVAVSVMVFFALCCQCASTLAIIRRETKSWAWPLFTFAYMTALAYIGALIAFQLGAAITDWVQ